MFRDKTIQFIRRMKEFFLRSTPPYLKKTLSIKKLQLGARQIEQMDDAKLFNTCKNALALLKNTCQDFELSREQSSLGKMIQDFEMFLNQYQKTDNEVVHKKQLSADLLIQLIQLPNRHQNCKTTQQLYQQIVKLGDSAAKYKANQLITSPEDHS